MKLAAIDVSVRINNLSDDEPFVVFPGLFDEEVKHIDINQLQLVMEAAPCIFQQRNNNDKKRTQLLESYLPNHLRAAIRPIVEQLETVFGKVGNGRATISEVACIKSEPGCNEQDLHRDFNFEEEPVKTKKSYLNMVALQDNTKLVVLVKNKRRVITLKRGDLFVGRGDLVHSGASYKVRNIRLHWFVDCRGNKRYLDKTYLYDLATNSASIDDYYAGYYGSRIENVKLAHEVIRSKSELKKRRSISMTNFNKRSRV